MAISKKIEKEVEKLDKKESFKELMLKILDEESKGLFAFKVKYDELIKKYIEENVVGVITDDKN